MFDEIYAESAGDVTGSVSRKDARGITYTVKPTVAPCGDLKDNATWIEACKEGGSISDKVKDDTGCNRQRSLKEATGKQTVKAMSKLFGITVKGKGKQKEGTVSEDDTALENAAK